nr:hypothetical protein [Chloroflexota bacterium]
MHRRKRPQHIAKPLELSFRDFFLRLSEQERRRVVQELSQPFQRLWLIVDAQGVKRLEDEG